MQTVIIVIHLMVVSAMVGMVLLQRSEGGGLGMGGGSGFLTSRGTANVLTRATAILAAMFFATSLLMSIIAGWSRAPHSILTKGPAVPAGQTAPAPPTPGNILDQLKPMESQSSAPPAPAPKRPMRKIRTPISTASMAA